MTLSELGRDEPCTGGPGSSTDLAFSTRQVVFVFVQSCMRSFHGTCAQVFHPDLIVFVARSSASLRVAPPCVCLNEMRLRFPEQITHFHIPSSVQ